MEKEDIREKDREYLSRCLKAVAYCADRLGWRTIECTEEGQMRAVEDIQVDFFNC